MKHEYYIYWYRLDSKDLFLIWFTDEQDGVFVDKNGFVLSFKSVGELKTFTNRNQIEINTEDPILLNLDLVENWLNEKDAEIKDYNTFNNVWNFFTDISSSTGGKFDNDKTKTHKIYEKIFWGCNLPVVTPVGKSYEPIWSETELKIIRETLKSGFQMFREKILIK